MKIRDILARPKTIVEKVSTVSERLSCILSIKGIKQSDLSRMSGISRGTISNYVQGRYSPKNDVIKVLASALQVSADWLSGYNVPMEISDAHYFDEEDPDQLVLTGVDKELYELLMQIPEEQKKLFLEMGRVFVNNLNKG